MIQWLAAVVTASVFGSLHCVGMCGPFVLIATQTPVQPGGSPKFLPLASYHLGRLSTYLVLGLLVGWLASATEGIAGRWGIGHAASILVGATLVLLGLARLWKLASPSTMRLEHSKWFSHWHQVIAIARKRIRTESPIANAYVWGLLSTWLPCGWLYLFVLAAATAGGWFPSMMMMGAFWLGTLPALSIVAWGGTWFRKLNPQVLQWGAAILLVVFGWWTLTTRSSIDLSGMARRSMSPNDRGQTIDAQSIEALQEIELPCCSSDEPSEVK